MRAAVPKYIPEADFKGAPPGHRFRLYFKGWDDKKWKIAEDSKDGKEGKHAALRSVVELTQEHKTLLQALLNRQLRLADHRSDKTLIAAGIAKAPFVTGMGMEHPLENGFAFLDPYGLPYLPGSSVKGVVRRAAEEMALFDSGASGWSLLDVWWLFGFDENAAFFHESKTTEPEPVRSERKKWLDAYSQAAAKQAPAEVDRFMTAALPSQVRKRSPVSPPEFLAELLKNKQLRRSVHLRGSLSFWDVYPNPPKDRLRVDIMNPHHGDYYQKGAPPGDWEDPNPIFFLAMERGTRFRFVVELFPVAQLPEGYRSRWQPLMEAAFNHAFSWLGFGAKTSLGYGLMRDDPDDQKHRDELEAQEKDARKLPEESRRQAERRQKNESLDPFAKLIHDLENDADLATVDRVYKDELDSRSGEDQKKLAAALMKAYLRHGKWGGKQSEKQKAKNKKLKDILGEA